MPLSAVDFFFQKSKKSLRQKYNQIHSIKTVWVQMRQHFVGHDLGPIRFQRLSADNTFKVKAGIVFGKVNCSIDITLFYA